MLFNSYEFVFLFLPIVVLIFNVLARKQTRLGLLWLLAVSFFFYGWWDRYFLILLLASVSFNYILGLALGGVAGRPRIGTVLLIVSVSVNLVLLGYFKYKGFFADNFSYISGFNLSISSVILPLGISFFTFEQISYLVDVRWRGTPERDPLRYALFVTFFPRLVAGPILRASEILPQLSALHERREKRLEDLAVGLTMFFIGLFKKTFLADGIALYAAPPFAAAAAGERIDFLMAWGGALAYSFQLYFDFSGYSDMAIGIARCFGIYFPANFLSPYKACSIVDFWRRWHITLSRFLRDYVYIAIGGSRKGLLRRQANLLATMLLGGLWHGANWTFVAWGGLHGVYLIVNHAWVALSGRSDRLRRVRQGRLALVVGWLLTFLAVVIAWVFFRAASLDVAVSMLYAMAGGNGISVPAGLAPLLGPLRVPLANLGVTFSGSSGTILVSTYAWVVALLAIALLAPNTCQLLRHWSPVLGSYDPTRRYETQIRLLGQPKWLPSRSWAVAMAAMAAIGLLSISRAGEFLYWQF